MCGLRLINFIPFSQNPPANQHVPAHVQLARKNIIADFVIQFLKEIFIVLF